MIQITETSRLIECLIVSSILLLF